MSEFCQTDDMNNALNNSLTDTDSRGPGKLAWLAISTAIFVSFFLIALLFVILLNDGWLNRIRMPVFDYMSSYPTFLLEQPLEAIEFISTKSFIIFSSYDERSGLNYWSLDYDSITLLVYILCALFSGWLINRYMFSSKNLLNIPLTGLCIIVFAFTYMTALDHCAGATWAGFVILYGIGISGFNVYPYYQAIFTIVGLILLGWGLVRLQTINQNTGHSEN